MAKPPSRGTIEFNPVSGDERRALPDERAPFRLLLLGDFSGRESRGVCEPLSPLASRRILRADRDSFDEAPGKLGTILDVPVGGAKSPPTRLRIRDLEDLHPDQLFERVD